MKTKSNNYKLIPVIAAVSVFISFYLLYVYANGSPLKASKINKQADIYLQQTYPEIRGEFYREDSASYLKEEMSIWDEEQQQYRIIDDCWVVYYSNSTSLVYFVYDKDFNLLYDSCGDRYLSGGNIYQGLSEQYSICVMQIFDKEYTSDDSPYSLSDKTPYSKSYGCGVFENSLYDPAFPAVENSALTQYYQGPVLDISKEYTVEELASQYGILHFNFNDGIQYWPGDGTSPDDTDFNNAVDNLYKRCLEIRDIVERNDLSFNRITVTQGTGEGLFMIDCNQLFNENLYEYICSNYVVGQ